MKKFILFLFVICVGFCLLGCRSMENGGFEAGSTGGISASRQESDINCKPVLPENDDHGTSASYEKESDISSEPVFPKNDAHGTSASYWKKSGTAGEPAPNQSASDDGSFEYQTGYGYALNKNYREALNWYSTAAEKGNTDALFELGYMYYSGKGVQLNYAKAYEYFCKAASQGSVRAKDYVEYMQKNGL